MTTATPIRMTEATPDQPALLLAVELGAQPWQLGFTTGAAQRPREPHVPARHLETVREEIGKAKARCRGEAMLCRDAYDWGCACRYQDDAERF